MLVLYWYRYKFTHQVIKKGCFPKWRVGDLLKTRFYPTAKQLLKKQCTHLTHMLLFREVRAKDSPNHWAPAAGYFGDHCRCNTSHPSTHSWNKISCPWPSTYWFTSAPVSHPATFMCRERRKMGSQVQRGVFSMAQIPSSHLWRTYCARHGSVCMHDKS